VTVVTLKVLPARSEVTQEGWKPPVDVNVDARKVVPADVAAAIKDVVTF
jgi:hypothetical protein